MAKITIEVPDDVADLAPELERLARAISAATPKTEGGVGVDTTAFGEAVEAGLQALELETKRRFLQRLDVDAKHIVIGEARYVRVGRYPASYKTKAGEVTVMRSIYRAVGIRNGPTVDTVSLRTGAVGDGWLPETAVAMAFLIQQGTSREAQATAVALGRLPFSRSSFERVGHHVGKLVVDGHARVEAELRADLTVPADAFSVSVGLDRVSIAMEEPRKRPRGRPKKGAPKRPVTRAYRMAYVGTVCLHDKDGAALKTIRYGRMPAGNEAAMCRSLKLDVEKLLAKNSDLKLVTLADGAPEMQGLLAANIQLKTLKKSMTVLVDYWHVVEKLGKAAEAIWDTPETRAAALGRWKRALLERDRGPQSILEEINRTGLEYKAIGDKTPVHDAITYLTNNRERMNYHAARAAGLPIGSGTTEATCKSLFSIRMKRPGARWKTDTGEHVVQMRAMALSDRWVSAMYKTLTPLVGIVGLDG